MITFHRFLIGTAIVFCLGFAAWMLMLFQRDGAILSLVLGIAFAIGGAALGYYLKNLNRFLHP